ncbi:MAG: transposase [Chthoniobacterales bacterium]
MHSFTSCLVHCVWSTKNRQPFLTSDLHERLWPYLSGIAKENKMKTLAIGGVADHVHMTVSYIKNQAEHHRPRSFREEFKTMLRKHGSDSDERILD